MEISDIKQSLSINQVLAHYNHQADKNSRINCPFHPDKTPSMQVYPKTNTVYCFSSNCKTHGKSLDVIDFIMYKQEITKHEAILKAVEMLGGETKTQNPVTIMGEAKQVKSKTLSSEASAKEDLVTERSRSEILTKIFSYFRNGFIMRKDNKSRIYLESRKLEITKLQNLGITIGYNSAQYHHNGKLNNQDTQSAIQAGLMKPSAQGNKEYTTYTIWASHCAIFPLKDEKGEITGMYARSTSPSNKPKAGKHFYLKNSKGLFYRPKQDVKKLIITESIIDFLSIYQIDEIRKDYDFLPIYGTNRLTQEHTEAVSQLQNLEEIIFFFDGDQAGEKAAQKYSAVLHEELGYRSGSYPQISITKVETPDNEDINSLLLGHETEIFSHLLDNRKLLFSSEKSIKNKESSKPITTLSHQQINALESSNPNNLKYQTKTAVYQIKGFKVQQLDSLKITLQVSSENRDLRTKLDLYEYKQLENTIKLITEKLGLQAEETEKDFYQLTNLLEEYQEQQQDKTKKKDAVKVHIPQETQAKCINFLKTNNLIKSINKLVGKSGIIGEEENRILLFIIASSYKMPDTLHALIQGSSGSGKTQLLKIISELMPDEDTKRYTRVTDNSFYNQDEYFFVNKLVCFEDMDGLKEDAQLAVRELQSNEILRTSTSIKDKNGSITGGERIVRGPIASLSCTTKGELYEDNISRSFLIAVDESKEQTLRIINYQNDKAAGITNKEEQQKIKNFLQNCIRLLQPYNVINPFANKIKLPQEAHKIRRLNELYQSFVRQITLINQYNRKRDRQGRLITDKEDLQTACDILFESIVLKVDELDGSLRQFFERLKSFVEKKGKDHEFNRFEIREAIRLGKSQQHYYINRLVELEYIQQKGFANRGYKYKIIHWDNISAVRAKIKDNLQNQLESI